MALGSVKDRAVDGLAFIHHLNGLRLLRLGTRAGLDDLVLQARGHNHDTRLGGIVLQPHGVELLVGSVLLVLNGLDTLLHEVAHRFDIKIGGVGHHASQESLVEEAGSDRIVAALECARHARQDLLVGLLGDGCAGAISYESWVASLGDGLTIATNKLGYVSRVDVQLVLQIAQQALCGGITRSVAHRIG